MPIDKTTIFMERLVKAQSELNAFVFSLMPENADGVQEVVQQTNLALLTLKDQYDPARPFKPWALTFAKHQVQAFLRDRGRERVLFSSELIDRVAELYDDGRLTPGETDAHEDLLKRLAICRGKLKDPEQLLLALFYDRHLPVKQMAKEIRMTPASIRVTLTKIRKKLGNCLRELCQLAEEDGPGDRPGGSAGRVQDSIIEGSRTLPRSVLDAASQELAQMDDAALREYVDQFRVHALLSGGHFAAPRTAFAFWRRRGLRVLAVAAAFALLVSGAFWWAGRSAGTIAVVERAYCALNLDGSPVAAATALAPGEWRWGNGILDIRMKDSTRVLVEAPAVIRAYSATHLQLFSGNLTVKMAKGRNGFVVDTPKLMFIDLGTEFGVSVAPDGESRVQVFDGAVLARSNLQPVERKLTQGEAAASDAAGDIQMIQLRPNWFIRRFPPRAFDAPNGGMAFNKPRYSVMKAYPAPRPVTVDGSLAEWPTNLTFRAACEPPYDKSYWVEARLMYDAANLYLGVSVGDPDPMRNQNAGQDVFNFAGGSVVCRLAEEGAPNPMRSVYSPRWGWMPTEEDAARLVSIICYYDAVERAAALYVQGGLTKASSRPVFTGSRWKGVFRKHPDGLGYTFEYAIPWSTLEIKPPQPGESRANTWNIHWSDAEGRVCVGQLAENIVPFESPFPYPAVPFCHRCLPTWGRLLFNKQGE